MVSPSCLITMPVALGDTAICLIELQRRIKNKKMKKVFRKITAFGVSALMVGMTAGVAVAANFPAPFVDDGVADVAVVYGTGEGVSSLDMVHAGNIQTTLGETVTGTTTTTGDGDVYKFEKTSTKFQLGDGYTDVISSSLDEDELPALLGDGKYFDNDNDEIDYSQKITMVDNDLTMFEDGDYVENQPTVGFKISSGATILTYQLAFSDTLLLEDMPTTELPIMGKTYYVLSNTSTTLTLLDSAEEAVLEYGETKVVGGKTVFIDFISSSEVKLNVDGEVTNSLAETGTNTFKLADGSYVGIKDITAQDYQGGIQKVEFSIGKGKLKLTDGDVEVQINDNNVPGLESDFSLSASVMSNIELAWKADDDLFVTEDFVITMPEFEVVSLSYGGLNYPAEEIIEVKQGGELYATLNNFPLKDGEADIDFLYATTTGSFVGFGKDATNQLLTGGYNGASLTFNDDNTHNYFVASWSDGSDAESYLMRFNNIRIDGSDNKTDLQYMKDGVWTNKKEGMKDADTVSVGNVEISVTTVSKLGSTKTVVFVNNSANTNFHTLYSEEGATFYLPYEANTSLASNTYPGSINFTDLGQTQNTGHDNDSFYLVMKEEDKSENKYSGDWINMTIGWDSSTVPEVEVSAVNMVNTDATSTEIGDTDVWRDFTYSALATEILYNKPSSGQKSVKLVYHGDEVAADVFITSADAVITSGGLGDVLVTDAEVATVSSKNLIVVGGSCINAAAATLLGGGYCGPSFTSATDVGAGQFLIQSFGDAYTTGKIALLVAGYNVDDTVNAATFLRTNDVDTTAGNKYVGTSSTEATLQVA